MTPEAAMKLEPGPLLDLQVHVHVFEKSPADKKMSSYSSDPKIEPIREKMSAKGFRLQTPAGAHEIGFIHPRIPLQRCIFAQLETAGEAVITTSVSPAVCRTAVASVLRLAEIEQQQRLQ